MGVKQSKRSVDITEISTKGEIEGFGNEGKVEKIIEGVAEKVAANGHVDGDLVNGGESQQNGIEAMQNTEAAVPSEKVLEMRDSNESAAGVVNGNVENGEINGETEKIDEEPKKTEDKKDKKKDKKEKVVKKKFSFRNFSFSKKDKSKPSKEEKSPERMIEAQTEEAPSSPIQEQNATEDETVNFNTSEESATQINSPVEVEAKKTVEEQKEETVQISGESKKETVAETAVSSEDLPPPLPASPPPNEILATEQDSSIITVENTLSSVNEVACTVTNIISEKIETTEEVIKSAEQIAIETGKQIEEKATNLLKTVEERAGESMKTVEEFISQKTEEIVEACQNAKVISEPVQQDLQIDETAEKMAENIATAPVKISNVDSLATNPEDSLEKREEGAGESLADIPQDLKDVTEATIEPTETDSLEISAIPPPPPVVEPVTGE